MNISEKHGTYITLFVTSVALLGACFMAKNIDSSKGTKKLAANNEISKALNYKIHEIINKNEINKFQKPPETNFFGGEIKISNDEKNNINLIYSGISDSLICHGIIRLQRSHWYSVNGFVLSDAKQIKENGQKICPPDSESITLTFQY